MKELKYINKFFIKYKWTLLFGLITTIVASLFKLLVPMKVGDSINIVQDSISGEISDISSIKTLMLKNIFIILGAALLSAFLTFLMRQSIIVVSRNIEFDLKNEIYNHYQELDLNFYKQHRTGDLMNRISEDVSSVRMYAGPAIMYGATTLTLFGVTLSYMFIKAPILSLYAIAPLPFLSFAIYKLSIAIHKRSTIVQEYLSKLTTKAQESFSGIRVIKSYGIEKDHYEDFSNLAHHSMDKNIDLAKVQAFFIPLMLLLIGLSNIVVIYIGGKQYINGQIDLGTVVEFLFYVNMLSWPVASVGWITSMVQRAEASQKRINEFLNTQPNITSPSKAPFEARGHIAFQNLSFRFPETGIQALNNLSFELKQGESLAIMGNTGSGKTTILDLIGRLYDPDKGRVLIDGKNTKEVNLTELRNAIGYVPQDAFLFSESIEDNIRFGKQDAKLEEIETAAKNASVHDNILNLKNEYQTILGERGITLSGGQKQRVSIARALIKQPKILLLDDSLSAVDTETEERILHHITKALTGITTIIVCHRISTAMKADRVIVLEKGKMLQEGTHNELLNKEGYYKDLYTKQLLEKEI